MKDNFVGGEWDELCGRLLASARAHDSDTFVRQANEFCALPPPERYPELLSRVRAAAQLTLSWQSADAEHRHEEALIDEALEESFPASDPPTWSTSHV